MSHDILSNMLSPRQYLGEMLGRGLGVTQLYLVFGDLTGDWAFAVVAFVSKDFCIYCLRDKTVVQLLFKLICEQELTTNFSK